MVSKHPSSADTRSEPPPIKVTVKEEGSGQREFRFQKNFFVGRESSCEVQVEGMGVSRRHAEVYFEKGRWWIKDLKSANGTFINGEKVEKIPLGSSTRVDLGSGDAEIFFSVEGFSSDAKTIREKPPSVTQYVQRYFNEKSDDTAGEHTQLIRGAFRVVQKKQKKKYYLIISALVMVAMLIGAYSIYQYRQVQQQKMMAQDIFYSMKSMELELAQMRSDAELQGNTESLNKLSRTRSQREELLRNYDKLLEQMHFYEDAKWNETDRIILQIARTFGECELGMPKDFLKEVYRYIKKWKSTNRLENALLRAVSNGYPDIISKTMLEYHLPPQFFYLALQESDFVVQTIGPRTRFGIAKGIWQFIPATAARYGLSNGPLMGLRRYDPRDERFDVVKSTEAAAKYVRDLYESEAQASGLLVIASYNWGERKVRDLIREMPHNPQDRNFWELLKLYRTEIPGETYDYVFYIISAAVIGENPDLFGFAFKNPLALVSKESR